jgi:WD40 repeat protein
VHSARVTEIIYDRTLNRLFSTGRDKKLHIHDMGTGAPISTTRCGDAWISSMVFDEATQRVILGSYAQQLMLYDVSQDSQSAPRSLCVLDGQRGSIRCVCYDAASRYCFSGGFDYSVCMWDIGVVGKESVRSRLVAQFKNGPQAKCKAVAYCPRTRHVLAGYETGMIAVYDSRSAEVCGVWALYYRGMIYRVYRASRDLIFVSPPLFISSLRRSAADRV